MELVVLKPDILYALTGPQKTVGTKTKSGQVLAANSTRVCTPRFSDDFQIGDTKAFELSPGTIVFGNTPYTSNWYTVDPSGNVVPRTPHIFKGAIIADFLDPLIPSQRPNGGNYQGNGWTQQTAITGCGFNIDVSQSDGVYLGGTGSCGPNPNGFHENYAVISRTLPSGNTAQTFKIRFKERIENAQIGNNPDEGSSGTQVGGIIGSLFPEPAHIGHPINFTNGFGAGSFPGTPGLIRTTVYDALVGFPGDPHVVWTNTLLPNKSADPAGHFHTLTIDKNSPNNITACYTDDFGNNICQNNNTYVSYLSSLRSFDLHASVYRPGQVIRAGFRDFQFNWLTSAGLISTNITLPAGHTSFGVFTTNSEIRSGINNITYKVIASSGNCSGVGCIITPGTDLGALLTPGTTSIRLQANLSKTNLDDPSPILKGWSVETCYPIGWMITQNGDTYVKDGVQQSSLSGKTYNGSQAYISTYNFLQSKATLDEALSSLKGFTAINYTDSNNKDWFTTVHDKVAKNLTILTSNRPTLNNGQTSELTQNNTTDITAVEFNGDLSISNSTCNTKTILFINGDLTISPEFTVSAADKGCMLVVSGKTTITVGTNRVDNQDHVQAFILTNKFISNDAANEDDTLVIQGSVITNSQGNVVPAQVPAAEFNRNISKTVVPDRPSEVITFDPRYLTLFRSVLNDPIDFTIKEKQFIETIPTPTVRIQQ